MNVRRAVSPLGTFCTFFWTGCSPIAPGTVGSLATVGCYALFLRRVPPMFYAAMVVVLFLAGAAASGRFARIMGRDDPGFIVIDEVCGQMIALFLVSPSLLNLALSFALFRFFDIIKPFPVRNAEGFPGGWGIMADDVVAGVFAALVLRLALIII